MGGRGPRRPRARSACSPCPPWPPTSRPPTPRYQPWAEPDTYQAEFTHTAQADSPLDRHQNRPKTGSYRIDGSPCPLARYQQAAGVALGAPPAGGGSVEVGQKRQRTLTSARNAIAQRVSIDLVDARQTPRARKTEDHPDHPRFHSERPPLGGGRLCLACRRAAHHASRGPGVRAERSESEAVP